MTAETFKQAWDKPDDITVTQFDKLKQANAFAFTVECRIDLNFIPLSIDANVRISAINFRTREISGVVIQ